MSTNSEDVNKFLNYREKVYYTGNYDVLLVKNNADVNSVPCNITANLNGYNLLTSRFAYVEDKLKPDLKLLWEQCTIGSWDVTLLYIEGQLNFTSLYPDSGDLGVTTNNAQVFNVTSGTGIYKNIHKVIIDYRKPVRNIYFIGYSDFAPK